MNILFFDTETTGIPKDYKAPITDVDNWPRLVQLAYVLVNDLGKISEFQSIISPEGFIIPQDAIKIHGITNEKAISEGLSISEVLTYFLSDLRKADVIVGHNISFDRKVIGAELIRAGLDDCLHGFPRICTMMKGAQYIKATGGKYKWPQLKELHQRLFGIGFEGAHDAMGDINATRKCYFELRRLHAITNLDIQEALNKYKTV